MKTASSIRMSADWRHAPGLRGVVLAAATFLLLAAPLHAATVTSISGGYPTNSNLNSFAGFQDGLMAGEVINGEGDVARYNEPIGIALNPAGTLLYFADMNNSRLRVMRINENEVESITNNLANPIDVVVDPNNEIYVLTQTDGLIRRFDSFHNFRSVVNPGTALTMPTAMALDSDTNFYAVEIGGTIQHVNRTTGVVTPIPVTGGVLSSPEGIAVLENGNLAVSDTGNHVMRILNTLGAIQETIGTLGTPGRTLGDSTVARFDSPRGVAQAGNNEMVVADRGNHRVVTIAADGTVRLLYGADPAEWMGIDRIVDEIFPGWKDGGDDEAWSREPHGVVVDGAGDVYVTELFFEAFRKVTDTGLDPPSGTQTAGGDGVVLNPPNLAIAPNSGYFPMGTEITVTSQSGEVYFTTDGTEPTTNSTQVAMSGGVGTIELFTPLQDLTQLSVAAFTFSGTNTAVTNVTGVTSPVSELGLSGDVNAGIGSTQLIPISLNLRPEDSVKSVGFNVEIVPDNGAPAAVPTLDLVAVDTNSFVTVVGPSSDGNPVNFLDFSFTRAGGVKGLTVVSPGTTNLSMQNFGVLAMLKVQMPTTASEGDTYKVRFSQVSASSDGSQTQFPILPMSERTLLVTNISYLVGDSSPGRWYGAGDFGNDDLDITDVNNAFLASLGIREPEPFTDVFDAMNTFPLDSPGIVGGGSFPAITFNDVDVIIKRQSRVIDEDNWRRSWSAGGTRVNMGPQALPFPNSPAQPLASGTESWSPHGRLQTESVGNVAAGATVRLPVYFSPLPNFDQAVPLLEGVQFRATVAPDNGGPGLEQRIAFEPADGMSGYRQVAPQFLDLGSLGLGWYGEDFTFSGIELLGHIVVKIPEDAGPGHCYLIDFSHVGAGAVAGADPIVETLPGCILVDVPPDTTSVTVPREWSEYFFEQIGLPDAEPHADPDGDGVPNWAEYLAGTDPRSLVSRLELKMPSAIEVNGSELKLPFATMPGKRYQLECTSSLAAPVWEAVGDPVEGDGSVLEVLQQIDIDEAKFYRLRLLQ